MLEENNGTAFSPLPYLKKKENRLQINSPYYLLSMLVMFSFDSSGSIGVARLAKCAFSEGKWEVETPFGIWDFSSPI